MALQKFLQLYKRIKQIFYTEKYTKYELYNFIFGTKIYFLEYKRIILFRPLLVATLVLIEVVFQVHFEQTLILYSAF